MENFEQVSYSVSNLDKMQRDKQCTIKVFETYYGLILISPGSSSMSWVVGVTGGARDFFWRTKEAIS